MLSKELFAFMHERHAIYERKHLLQKPKPWTEDPILQKYRFCNVYRELDTQTQWLANNWRNDDADFWFASLVFRFVNWGESAAAIGYPVPWNANKFRRGLEKRKAAGDKVYSGAYMISTHGVQQEKHIYLAGSLTKIWKDRARLRYRVGEHLEDFHERLMGAFDVGSFLAAQVIADAKYAGDMREAPDWHTFAASGPGSRRGLNRVFLQPVKQPIKEENWRLCLATLYKDIKYRVERSGMPRLHAQDLQNCLCEFDKYERVRLGEGRPKSLYKGV